MQPLPPVPPLCFANDTALSPVPSFQLWYRCLRAARYSAACRSCLRRRKSPWMGLTADQKRCACPTDLQRHICRSRGRAGWCAFAVRLFSPLGGRGEARPEFPRRCSSAGPLVRDAPPPDGGARPSAAGGKSAEPLAGHMARLWDAASGQELGRFVGHAGRAGVQSSHPMARRCLPPARTRRRGSGRPTTMIGGAPSALH